MSARMTAPPRRGACPGLSAPMPTGDGLLVRLQPTGTIPLAVFAELCGAGRRRGNGVIEVTSRGSIQVRGLSSETAPQFAADVAALGIAADDGVPILCSPLAGIGAEEIIDSAALAAELRHALAQRSLAATLSPKVSVAVDGGGALGLASLSADIRLRAHKTDAEVTLSVGVGGDAKSATGLGNIAPAHGVEAVIALLDVIARHGRATRAREIDVAEFHSAITDISLPGREADLLWHERDAIGAHPLRDGSLACGVGLAFGHSDATTLERLTEVAKATGAKGFRAAPGRALLAIGLPWANSAAFAAAAEELGFITRANDKRRNIFACAGAPICTSAHIAARALAPAIANQMTALGGDDFTVHISGCAKGCARAAPATLTVVGMPDGCALVAGGTARDGAFAQVATRELPEAIARFASQRRREAAHV
jgi:precorrin-3B synthase